jgi:hypothetical protein
VLNALQQLGSAVGVADIGTVFFSTVNGHDGGSHPRYVAGLERSLEVGIGVCAAVLLLTFLLPPNSGEDNNLDVELTAASAAQHSPLAATT